ncbi:hypothetical protein [Thermotoga sp. TBGT1766]|nr:MULTISPECIES: hypothetical protein [unclassified Thermotoga]
MPAKVYFTDMTTNPNMNMLQKLELLLKKVELEKIIEKRQVRGCKTPFR